MMRRPPKFVQGYVDHHGHARHYFRRPATRGWRCRGLPWSPDFMAEYPAAMAGEPPKPQAITPTVRQGSFAALATSYFTSTAYRASSQRPRDHNNAIGRLASSPRTRTATRLGPLSAATLRREQVVEMMKGCMEKPDQANLFAGFSARSCSTPSRSGCETTIRLAET